MREVKALVKYAVSHEDRTKYLKPARIRYVNSGDETDADDNEIVTES